jgi:mono/diheme cytochrome c family protein
MRRLYLCFLLLTLAGAPAARAADADNGQRVVQARCASCHAVFTREQRKLAEALPLEAIARKYDFNADALAFSLLDPHPRMNEPLTRREAQDVAAYIVTLAR